jgi:hypothetical protein
LFIAITAAADLAAASAAGVSLAARFALKAATTIGLRGPIAQAMNRPYFA